MTSQPDIPWSNEAPFNPAEISQTAPAGSAAVRAGAPHFSDVVNAPLEMPGADPGALPLDFAPALRVKIIGIGDAGSSILQRLNLADFPAVARAVVNTDTVSLSRSPVLEKVRIGQGVTRGMGTGGESSAGSRAAESDKEVLSQLVAGHDLVFLVAGLGGGTGSGATPLIAKLAAQAGAMVVAFVTMPFSMEGARRGTQAQSALVQLRLNCEIAVPIRNDLLMQTEGESGDAGAAFAQGDLWIERGVCALCAMLFKEGRPKVDIATLRKSFPFDGRILFSIGRGTGKDALNQALAELERSPLLHMREIKHAAMLVVSIRHGNGFLLAEVDGVVRKITSEFGGREQCEVSLIQDEAFGGFAEICIIGSTGGVRPWPPASQNAPAPPTPRPIYAPPPPLRHEQTLGNAADTVLLGATKPVPPPQPERSARSVPEQTMMDLGDPVDGSNFFNKVSTDLIDGQNIDVPTFLRRGMKIITGLESAVGRRHR